MLTPFRFKLFLTATTVIVLAAFAGLAYLDFQLRPAGSWQCEKGSWRQVGDPRGLPPETGCEPVASSPAPAAAPDCGQLVTKDAKADEAYWQKTGHLGRYEPCMKGNAWYLKYATPAGNRLLELAFAPDADCSVDGMKAKCTEMNPPAGSKSSMSGLPDGAFLRLNVLKFMTK